jgi:hypothetical protein
VIYLIKTLHDKTVNAQSRLVRMLLAQNSQYQPAQRDSFMPM